MKNNIDLTSGNIRKNIIKFTSPILGTSFINMTYTFVDMICIGLLGAGAVAAVGTAGFFLWFINASSSMARIGTQVYVSQSFGNKNYDLIKKYTLAAVYINFILGLLLGLLLLLFNDFLVSYFKLGDFTIINYTKNYLVIIAFSVPFMYVNPILSAMLNSIGNSRVPFWANSFGLVFNILFDILLIFGIGFFPRLEVIGAALATALAHIFVFIILFAYNRKLDRNYRINFFEKVSFYHIKQIVKTGFPPALQSTLYCVYSIVLARIIASFGSTSIAVQKVGSQIESISWMTADGLAIAATAFVGQNFGSKKMDRINEGIKILLIFSSLFGIFATILLVFFGREVFSIFLRENDVLMGGIDYLKILGYSQIFMCFEILYIGIFNGFGETKFPSLVSIILTGMRIPLALYLSKIIGVDGIWWAISSTSIAKGIILTSTFYLKYSNKYLA